VLAGFDLDVAPGERIAVMGPSGAGKTTLLALLGGLERVQEGSIVVGTTALGALRGDALAAYRHASVGFVFQHFGLLGNLTARENVELAMTLGAVDRRRRRGRADELLAAVGIADRADHRPAQLSGGESQRVALARALANEPPLVLADEPTGNLDGTTATVVLDLLDEIARERGVTMVTVTHDPLVASRAMRTVELRAIEAEPA
jgi:putative ABC transport system ATP-binding protein